jgi:hypothetical protein
MTRCSYDAERTVQLATFAADLGIVVTDRSPPRQRFNDPSFSSRSDPGPGPILDEKPTGAGSKRRVDQRAMSMIRSAVPAGSMNGPKWFESGCSMYMQFGSRSATFGATSAGPI